MKIPTTLIYRARASALAIGAAVVMLLPAATRAQVIVWHDDFDQHTNGANSGNGSYGRIAYNFAGAGVGNPLVLITNALPDDLATDPSFTHSNYCAFIFTSTNTQPPLPLNFGWDMNSVPTTGGNTNAQLRAYTLQYDIRVQGDGVGGGLGGFIGPVNYVFGHNNTNGGYSSGEYYGNGAQTNITAGFFPPPASGWVHKVMPMGSFGTANAGALVTTNPAFSFGFGAFMAGLTNINRQEIDVANVMIVMDTNPPPIPPPVMGIVPAKPGLRIFTQDTTATYNQEGFGTVDANQTWTYNSFDPVSYSITIGDFDTVNGYTLYVQFAPGAASGDPFGVYNDPNALVWQITRQSAGFTTRVDFKTNAPQSGQNNIALPTMTTTSTNGRGTWTLTFTNDPFGSGTSYGMVTAPDGTNGTFVLPPEVTALFGNPLTILFGTSPNSTAGYGQFIDISSILITNVPGANEYDDFTKDSALNTALWNPAFSLNAGSVVQVTTNTPYWVTWTTPDIGYGLGTKASLTSGTNGWFTPAYYGSGVGVSNTVPTRMGLTKKWTLIPKGSLPTVDGTTNGAVSPTAFFRLSNPPPPSQ